MARKLSNHDLARAIYETLVNEGWIVEYVEYEDGAGDIKCIEDMLDKELGEY